MRDNICYLLYYPNRVRFKIAQLGQGVKDEGLALHLRGHAYFPVVYVDKIGARSEK